MKYLKFSLSVFLFSILVASCGNPEAEKAAQQAKEDSLLNAQEDSLLDAFRYELEAISKEVNEVASRNGILNIDTTDGAILSKESILEQVSSLDGLLANNQKQLNDLYARMRESKVKNEQLEKLITDMQNRIAEREGQIDKLMQMLADKDVVIEDIKANLDSIRKNNISLTEDVIKMDQEMHIVYFLVGEQKELMEMGVVTKEGGILGLGAAKKLDASKLDVAKFNQVDERELTDVPLYSKKAKLVTNHPEASYEFVVDGDGKIESLMIKDRKRFWSVSDFLVIEVSN